MKSINIIRNSFVLFSYLLCLYCGYIFFQIVLSDSAIIKQIFWWPLVPMLGFIYFILRPAKKKYNKKIFVITALFLLSLVFNLVIGVIVFLQSFNDVIYSPIVDNDAFLNFIIFSKTYEPYQIQTMSRFFSNALMIVILILTPIVIAIIREIWIYSYKKILSE